MVRLTSLIGPIYLMVKYVERHSQRDNLLHHGHVHACRSVGCALKRHIKKK